jgi:hypothetical protein
VYLLRGIRTPILDMWGPRHGRSQNGEQVRLISSRENLLGASPELQPAAGMASGLQPRIQQYHQGGP